MSGVSASLRPTSLGAAGSLADEVGFDLFLENILSYPAEKISRAPENVRHNTNTSANRLTDGSHQTITQPSHAHDSTCVFVCKSPAILVRFESNVSTMYGVAGHGSNAQADSSVGGTNGRSHNISCEAKCHGL